MIRSIIEVLAIIIYDIVSNIARRAMGWDLLGSTVRINQNDKRRNDRWPRYADNIQMLMRSRKFCRLSRKGHHRGTWRDDPSSNHLSVV